MTKRLSTTAAALWCVAALLLAQPALAATPAAAPAKGKSGKESAETKKAEEKLQPWQLDAAWMGTAQWRELGPYRGGRSAAATGVVGKRDIYYFGATGGGVFKTEDAGQSWKSASDGFFGGSIGAVAVSEWDDNVIYVGTGEKTVRGNVSHGDGMWKSMDAGKTWKHVGLGDSRHIPRVRIHPRNPELVYAAALGHLFGPNEERGVFRSRNGGATWEKVLYVNENAGAVDLVLDPNNPRVLYAAMWRVLRTPYSLESGGEGSGLWKSIDGGDTWTEISRKKGLPKGTLGIIGVDVSRTNSQNVYAIVEAENGGVFRSRDGGETWTRVNEDRSLRQRAWYYSRIYADPSDEDRVYVLNVGFHFSKDGGKTFERIDTPHGDNHDLWLDPADPRRMIQANDGGVNVSNDGGQTWTGQHNQPTSQMYRIATDNAFPYRILGGQQDNTSVRINSRSFSGPAVGPSDWSPSAGCESAHMAPKPDNPDIVVGGCYGGAVEIVNHRTGESRDITVLPDDPMGWGAADLKYRFQWNHPIFFSKHDPNRLFVGGNVLFQSDDLGQSWKAISPDLTRNDKSKMGPSGGPITKDNTSVEYYGTIFAVTESQHEKGVFWAGSDDGKLSLSRDGGATWTDVTPKGLPEWSMINSVDVHPFEKGGLYMAATRYKLDDFKPYLFKTTDWGKTWTKIVDGIDAQHFTRVVRADPDRRGLLYAGTERGVHVSFDDGAHWQSLQRNLPIVPVTDLALKDQDLIVATQGRGYWILDDLSTLHHAPVGAKVEKARLFAPRKSVRLVSGGWVYPIPFSGANPPNGVVFHYALPEEPKPEVELSLEILDADGKVLRTFTRKPAEEAAKPEARRRRRGGGDDKVLTATAGLQRFVWDFGYQAVEPFPGMITWNGAPQARAIPGKYKARLKTGDVVEEVDFEIVLDPRASVSVDDLKAQRDFVVETGEKLKAIHETLKRIREVRSQLEGLDGRLGEDAAAEDIKAARKAMLEKMETIEKALYQTQNRSDQDPLNFPIRLNDKLAGVMSRASQGTFRPTQAHIDTRRDLYAQIDPLLAQAETLWQQELPAINAKIQAAAVPAIVLDPVKAKE
jgi:photosystem II stability/assembly factor-like uncharacterized protein